MRRTRSAGRVWISGVAVVGRWSCHVGVVLALATASFDSPRCSAADDPFDGLRQRIEQLEQDNRELRAERPPRSSDSLISLVAEVPPAPIADVAGADDVESADEARIGSLVEKYLRRRAAEPVADLAQEDRKSTRLNSSHG